MVVGKRKAGTAAGLVLLVLMALSIFWMSGRYVKAADTHVFDKADLLTEEEEALLELRLQEFADANGMELAFVSAEFLEGKTTREYADDFYDENGLGLDEEYSGALLLIDMEHREFYISTCGKMIDYLTDVRIERILDDVADGIDESFYQAGRNFADSVEEYVQAGYEENAHRYDEETGEITDLETEQTKMPPAMIVMGALCLGLIVGGLRYLLVARTYKNYGEPDAYRYAGNSQVYFRTKEDRVLSRFVTHRHLPPPSSSSSGGSSAGRSTFHSSSSGRSHGGGGRGF